MSFSKCYLKAQNHTLHSDTGFSVKLCFDFDFNIYFNLETVFELMGPAMDNYFYNLNGLPCIVFCGSK